MFAHFMPLNHKFVPEPEIADALLVPNFEALSMEDQEQVVRAIKADVDFKFNYEAQHIDIDS